MHKTEKSAQPVMNAVTKDLIWLAATIIAVFIFSYFFDVFSFLLVFIRRHPSAVFYIDEIVSVLLALSIGLAVFVWRRLKELRIETAKRIKLQEKLIELAKTEAQTERIVSKQLHSEIELRKKM
jgi:hypothetical protein